jgi:hypothetical protein
MLIKRVSIGFILLLCCLSSGAGAQSMESTAPYVGAYWRDAAIDGDNLKQISNDGFNGLLLPALEVSYIADTGGWGIDTTHLTDPGNISSTGLTFILVIRLKLWDEGWTGIPDLNSASMIASDITKSMLEKIEAANGDGRVIAIAIEPLDKNPDPARIAQFLKWIRNNPAFQDSKMNFGIIIPPDHMKLAGFNSLGDAADILILNLTAMDPAGDPPRLIDSDWVLKSCRNAKEYGKPVHVIFPIIEKVIRYDKSGRMIDPDSAISFDAIIENADNVDSDAASNTTATISTQIDIDGSMIPAGTRFTHLKTNPGELADLLKVLAAKDVENINTIILDGLPYEPSERAYKPSQFVASLKGSTPSPAASTTPAKTLVDEVRLADSKVYMKGFYIIGIGFLIAMGVAGLSLFRKKNLKYDEESDKFIRKGDDE